MGPVDLLLQQLWEDYASMNKQAGVIHKALEQRGEKIVNDHVAFRTFDIPKVGLPVLAAPFMALGYRDAGEAYDFKDKKLKARYFKHPDPDKPKIFISELKVGECSASLQKTVRGLVDQVPPGREGDGRFLVSGVPWKRLSWKEYQELLKESEYAAWMAAFGFRVNHFTVFFNGLKTFPDLAALNVFIKGLGYALNASGGEIKGNPRVFLEQSSTMAYPVPTDFADRKETIPGCYYEFARRYPAKDGRLFQGFLPESADKIFESTHFRPASGPAQ